jgi:hypothetical protein
MVANKSLDAMQDKTGYLNNTSNWSGIGTNFNGVEFLGGEMSQNLNLSVQHQSIGVASSVALRHLLVRNSVFNDKSNVVYGTLPGIETVAYKQAEIAGLAGEFGVPFSNLSNDSVALINDFINQLPQKTKAYIVSELSSVNNSLNVLTSLGYRWQLSYLQVLLEFLHLQESQVRICIELISKCNFISFAFAFTRTPCTLTQSIRCSVLLS